MLKNHVTLTNTGFVVMTLSIILAGAGTWIIVGLLAVAFGSAWRKGSSSSKGLRKGGSFSEDDTSSSSSDGRRDNPFTPHYQQENGNTCMYCKYFDANSCSYFDMPQYVSPNTKACHNFS